jgi:hypothetical protein
MTSLYHAEQGQNKRYDNFISADRGSSAQSWMASLHSSTHTLNYAPPPSQVHSRQNAAKRAKAQKNRKSSLTPYAKGLLGEGSNNSGKTRAEMLHSQYNQLKKHPTRSDCSENETEEWRLKRAEAMWLRGGGLSKFDGSHRMHHRKNHDRLNWAAVAVEQSSGTIGPNGALSTDVHEVEEVCCSYSATRSGFIRTATTNLLLTLPDHCDTVL